MKEFQKFIRSSQLYVQSSQMRFNIASLERQIRKCNQQLQTNTLDHNTIRDLEDELFGCQIEVQSLTVRIHRLIAEVRSSGLTDCKQ